MNNQLTQQQYFANISQALADNKCLQPTLVIDKTRLDHNLELFKKVIEQGYDYRIVAKSLPSVPFLRYLMQATNSNRLMTFHLPFLKHLCLEIPQADILLGKPMPVLAAENFYQWLEQKESSFIPAQQLHWLIDSYARAEQYLALAEKLDMNLNFSLELDIGLHRGGFQQQDLEFNKTLELIKQSPRLTLTGLMGYEAHVSKIPALVGGSQRAFTLAMKRYQYFVEQVSDCFGAEILAKLALNSGGSSTYPLYDKTGAAHSLNISHELIEQAKVNEIATASALVKPTDFDVFTLDQHQDACFIAAPVLKITQPQIPMAEGLSSVMRKIGLMPKQNCFIYGGNWLAQPHYPLGAKRSDILGHSSNQEMYQYNGDQSLSVDDFFYFRPSQSEAAFLQFGKLALYQDGKIIDYWSIFQPEELR